MHFYFQNFVFAIRNVRLRAIKMLKNCLTTVVMENTLIPQKLQKHEGHTCQKNAPKKNKTPKVLKHLVGLLHLLTFTLGKYLLLQFL